MINVIPLEDLIVHEESSICICKPRVEIENGELLIIHDAIDGRTAVEQANEILGNYNNGKQWAVVKSGL